MTEIPLLSREQWLANLIRSRSEVPVAARAMYSTWANGIVTDPSLMTLPIDDHMVHRGDGVFEAARVVAGAIFDLRAHLDRLEASAAAIGLKLPMARHELEAAVVATVRAGGLREAAIRLFVGRGPGSFSPNPYDSPRSQLYVVVTDFKPMAERFYTEGATAILSKVPQKDPFFARIKSCNYLPNVLMKKEAVDAGADFPLGVSADGVLYEGATENLVLLSHAGVLRVPRFDYTLRGTTLLAVLAALQERPRPDLIKDVEHHDIRVAELATAREVFMIGTTLEVLPLVRVDRTQIGTGRPGPAAHYLRQLLRDQMSADESRRLKII